jgi:hypothetical protein
MLRCLIAALVCALGTGDPYQGRDPCYESQLHGVQVPTDQGSPMGQGLQQAYATRCRRPGKGRWSLAFLAVSGRFNFMAPMITMSCSGPWGISWEAGYGLTSWSGCQLLVNMSMGCKGVLTKTLSVLLLVNYFMSSPHPSLILSSMLYVRSAGCCSMRPKSA